MYSLTGILYGCPDHLTHLNSIDQATWTVWAAMHKYSLNIAGSISSVGIGSVDSSGALRGFGNTPMKESK